MCSAPWVLLWCLKSLSSWIVVWSRSVCGAVRSGTSAPLVRFLPLPLAHLAPLLPLPARLSSRCSSTTTSSDCWCATRHNLRSWKLPRWKGPDMWVLRCTAWRPLCLLGTAVRTLSPVSLPSVPGVSPCPCAVSDSLTNERFSCDPTPPVQVAASHLNGVDMGPDWMQHLILLHASSSPASDFGAVQPSWRLDHGYHGFSSPSIVLPSMCLFSMAVGASGPWPSVSCHHGRCLLVWLGASVCCLCRRVPLRVGGWHPVAALPRGAGCLHPISVQVTSG